MSASGERKRLVGRNKRSALRGSVRKPRDAAKVGCGAMRGVYHRAGQRPDPVAYCALRLLRVRSAGPIPRSSAGAVSRQVLAICQRPDMVFDGVAARARRLGGFRDRDAAAFTRQLHDFDRQLRQIAQQNPLALELRLQAALLLLQGAQEKINPRRPIRLGRPDRSLGSAQDEIIAVLALLDDALQRAVWHVGITGTQQEQRRQDAGEAAIAVLKKMNFQEDDDEERDHPETMDYPVVLRLLHP